MKKFALFLSMSILLSSCSLNDDLMSNYSSNLSIDNIKIEQKYEESYNKNQHKIYAKISKLRGIIGDKRYITRSEDCDSCLVANDSCYGGPLVDELINIPLFTIDSLYTEIEGELAEYEEQRDSCMVLILNKLIEITSEEEVQVLLNFKQLYIEAGGSNPEILQGACVGVSPIIRDFMIDIAGTIDGYVISSFDPDSHESCLEQLVVKLIESDVESHLIEALTAELGEIGLAIDVFFIGKDLYDEIKLTYEYNQCVMIQGHNRGH